jgi:hypothetical protein
MDDSNHDMVNMLTNGPLNGSCWAAH